MTEPIGRDDLRRRLEIHHEAAFQWALSCCRWDVALAEDVLQTCYLRVLDGRAKYLGRSSFKTWLFAVIRNIAADCSRRTTVGQFISLLPMREKLQSVAPDPEEELLTTERNRILMRALQQLPERQRQVLHLVFYFDLRIREAGEVLGISVGSARRHYERGKGRLRVALGENKEGMLP